MSPEDMIRVTAAISIVLTFLEPAVPNPRAAQDLQELRVRQVDEILVGCKLILTACGNCGYLRALYTLWKDMSSAMYTLEKQLWPEQAPDTQLFLNLPIEKKPLSALLLPEFDTNWQYVRTALQSLDQLYTWFLGMYDTSLHESFHLILEDAVLVFRTCDTMYRMKQRIMAAGPQAPPQAVDEQPGDAGAAEPNHPMELAGPDGTPLQWF